MKRVSGFLRFFLWSLIVIVALSGALFGYFVYSPAPEVPRLSGTLTHGTIEMGGRTRTYLSYVPLGLTKGAALVVVNFTSPFLKNAVSIRVLTDMVAPDTVIELLSLS